MDSKYALRDAIVDRLRRDLVGPRADDELLDETPFSAYIAGVLYPVQASAVAPR